MKIYELDSVHFLCSLELAWQFFLNKRGVKLELLTNNGMLMIVEKGVRGGICHAICRYAKANNNYIKNHDKKI